MNQRFFGFQVLSLKLIQNHSYRNADLVRLEKEAPAAYATFASTEVEVVDADCLTHAVNLARRGEVRKPTVLNMANPDHPGGGFDNGRLAQEEDMFRRTTCVAATPGPFKAFLHKNEDLRSLQQVTYPLEEFGVVYTENVEILRGEQKDGFPFLEQPVSCNIIACAAYQVGLGKRLAQHHNTGVGPTRQSVEMPSRPFESAVDMNAAGCMELTPTYAVLTFMKLRSLLLVAKKHGSDVLILSALGCGAFGNPPEHIAFIFREVLSDFAGAFKKIYFAIKGGNNLRTFSKMFENSRILTALPTPKVNIFEAHQAFEMLTDEDEKRICQFGGCCRDAWQLGCMEPACAASFHPPVCTCGSSSRAGKLERWHCELYTHKAACPRGALCSQMDSRRHSLVATHEVTSCLEGARRPNRDMEHERQFTHPPLCKKMTGSVIPEACKESREHMQQYRHPDPVCECYETICLQWMGQQQLRARHPPRSRLRGVKQLCPFMYCGRKRNPDHLQESLHLVVPRCSKTSCESFDPDHLDSFVHESAKRRLDNVCRYGRRCKDQSLQHHRDYRHEAISLKEILCPAYPLKPFNTFIDFAGNLEAARVSRGKSR